VGTPDLFLIAEDDLRPLKFDGFIKPILDFQIFMSILLRRLKTHR
jgi:hypothetical protein